MSIDTRLVREAYRRLLQREPENQAVVEAHARDTESFEQLLLRIAESDEYRNLTLMQGLRSVFYAPPQAIQVDVSDEQRVQLMDRVRREWQRLGENDPYWSVLSEERYRAKELSEAEVLEFLERGRDSAELVESFEARTRQTVSSGLCFELGCGVGRVTCHLAERFERVIAADISPGNIALCKKNLESAGITNVDYLLVDDLADYRAQPEFDFLYSVIVLQHNTPPIQKFILDALLGKVRSGGGCLFQTPASIPGYSFDASQYLTTQDELIEMHALPMTDVLGLLHAHGLKPLQVLLDSWTGSPGSYTYFAFKP